MRKILILLGFYIFSLSNGLCAIKVSPTVIELNTYNIRGNYITASFNVIGDKDDTVRFKVYPEFFNITEKGSMDIVEKSDSPNSLMNHIRFVPNEFTLKNGQSQKVRLTFTDIDKLPDGENRLVLFLEDVKTKEMILPYDKKDVTTKLLIKTRIGVPVYLDKGNFVKCANIDSLEVENKQNKNLVYNLKLTSLGNSKVRFGGKAQIIKDKQLIREFKVDSSVVKAKGILNLTNELDLKDLNNGNYTLRVVLNYEDEKGKIKSLVKESKFTLEKSKTIQNI